MARTLVNPHQLALFSGSTATEAKFAEGIYTGGMSMESGSLSKVGGISFYNGGAIDYVGSKINLFQNTNIDGTLTCNTSLTVDSVTLTDTELGYLDGLTLGTAAASKAMTLDASSDVTGARNITLSGELDAATLDIESGADIKGTTNLDAVDIDGNVQLDGTFSVGVDDTGFDVKLYGATAGRFLLWDESRDALAAADNVKLEIGSGQDMEIFHDGTDSFLTNKTGIMNIANGVSGIAVNIGHGTSEVTIGDNLTVAGNLTVTGTTTTVDVEVVNTANGVIFEGATADDFELTLKSVDPTADRTVQIADAAGFLIPFAAVSTTTISATPAELNLLDTAAAGTVVNSKGVIYGGSGEVLATSFVVADDSTFGAVGDTNMLTFDAGTDITVASDLDFEIAKVGGLKIAGSAVTSTPAELNLLDGGASNSATVTILDADGMFINDGGVSKLVSVVDMKTYIGPSIGFW